MTKRPKWLTKAVQLSNGSHITIGDFNPSALYMRMGAKRGLTVEGYIYLNKIIGKQVFVSRWVQISPTRGGGEFMISIEDGIVCGYLNSTEPVIRSTQILKEQNWYHLALTLNYTWPFELSLYIDGAIVSTGKMPSISGWKETLIGATKDTNGNVLHALDGYVGSVCLWHAWHDQGDILNDMNQPDSSRLHLGSGFDFSNGLSFDISSKQVPFTFVGGALIGDAPGEADDRTRNIPGSKSFLPTNSITAYKENEAPTDSRTVYMGYYLGGPQLIADSLDFKNKPFTFEVFFKAHADEEGFIKGGSLLSNIAVSNPSGPLFDSSFYFFSSILAIGIDNKLRFGVADNTTWQFSFIQSSYQVGDEFWHHVAGVRTENELLLYIDGQLDESEYISGPKDSKLSDISFDTLYVKLAANTKNFMTASNGGGQGLFPLAQGVSEQFYGKIGEFRIWNKALTQREVLEGMTKMSTGNEPHLAVYNKLKKFDLNAKANGSYEINSLVGPPLIGVAKIEEDGPTLQNPDSSYLIVQTNLMEDFSFGENDSVTPVTNYRTVITAKTFDGIPLKDESIIIQTVHEEAYLLADNALETKHELALTTNASGEVSFTMSAFVHDELFAPAVRARATFMAEKSWTIISMDKHAHYVLSNLTGDMLKAKTAIGSSMNEAPLVDISDDTAHALASSVNHLMNAVTDHNVHSFNQNRKRDHDVMDYYFQKQKPHPYENAFVSSESFSPENDVISSFHAVHEGPSEQESHIRTIAAKSMPNPHWGFKHDVNNNIASFETYENIAEVHQLLDDVNMMYLNSAAEYLHPKNSQKRSFTITELNESLREGQTEGSWFDTLYDAVKRSEHVIVHTAKHFVEEAKKDVHVVIVTAIVVESGVKHGLTAVVQKVEHAAKITKAFFQKLGVEAAKVIHFIKSIFNWSDILRTHSFAAHYVDELLNYIKHLVDQEKTKIVEGIDTIKEHIDTQLRDTSNHLLQSSIGSHKAKASYQHAGHGVQKGYLHRLISDHLGSPNTKFEDGKTGTRPTNVPGTEFDSIKQQLGNLLHDPKNLGKVVLAEIVTALKSVLDKAIELIKSGLESIFDLLESTIEELRRLLNAEIKIPILTSLYKYITNGEKLTILNLITLAGALPFTIIYKALNNTNAPYSQAELDDFLTKTWQDYDSYFKSANNIRKRSTEQDQMSITEDEKRLLKASWGIGYIFSASVLVQGVLTSINDVLIVPPEFESGPIGTAQTVAESLTQVFAFPFTIFAEEESGPWVLDMVIWFYQWAPLTLPHRKTEHTGEMSHQEALVWKLVYGVSHCLSFTALGIWEIDKGKLSDQPDLIMKMVANIASTVPEMDRTLSFDPDEEARIVQAVLDGIMFAAWSGLTIARVSVDIHQSKLTVCR